ncbi:hypothetical protein SEA_PHROSTEDPHLAKE_58 [Gordonia phage PhrostedPhlake]|nr:hypothetical protein SEA_PHROSTEDPHLAKE_58 [Gordonia phage PhrostedPhlake]
MTAPAISPAAIDAALPDFDAVVACEVEVEGGCDRPAEWRVRMHGPKDHRCGTYTLCMCDTHLTLERTSLENMLRAARTGLHCCYCGLFVTQVSEAIFSVVAL